MEQRKVILVRRAAAIATIAVLTTAGLPRIMAQAAQQSASAPSPPPAQSLWVPPAGTVLLGINRVTGRPTLKLPTEPIDGSPEQIARFASWRLHSFPGSGPYAATREEDPSLPTHTLYRPQNLASVPGKLPVILWANGGCRNTSVEFTRFLGELASQGYVVAAVGRNDVEFYVNPTTPPQPPAGAPPLMQRDVTVMLKGLDWLTVENARAGSKYYGKVDTAKVAALGQSCGGGQAFTTARDSRITTVVALNSSFPTADGSGSLGGGGRQGSPPAPTWTVEQLKIPAAYFVGGPADLAYVGSESSYAKTPATLPVLKAHLVTVGHTGAYPGPDVRWVRAVSSWLNWQLKGDASAKRMFAGTACGLCSESDWWLEKKNID